VYGEYCDEHVPCLFVRARRGIWGRHLKSSQTV
jgi:hypothetical protein